MVFVPVLGVYDIPETRLAAAIHVILFGFSLASGEADKALFCGLSASHGHGIGYLTKRNPSTSSLSEQSLL
ncbi:hypothetical protein SUDANB60_02705 [Streptomyces sp. enrichment culture]